MSHRSQNYEAVFALLEDLTEKDEKRYDELYIEEVVAKTPAAAKIVLRRDQYKSLRRDELEQWFPLSQLRKLDGGSIYASKYILREKNIT